MEISVLAIDLAKRVFQLHGVNSFGKAVLKRKVTRSRLRETIAPLSARLIVMEACAGSHFWGREFRKMGFEVRLIAPQFVKPFVKSNKNDAADAEAIAEAAMRPSMRFVPVKDVWHQNILSLHCVRKRVVASRVALTNEIHGLAHEYGVVLPLLRSSLIKAVHELIVPEDERLPTEVKELFFDLLEEHRQLSERILVLDKKVKAISETNETCRRLKEIPGVGPLVSTALYASIVDPAAFRNGREVSAWLGLVPRQHSSGGKELLLGISKRGDPYLRQILIHGARTVVYHAQGKADRLNTWIREKERTRGRNRTVVAVANKTARVAWVLMSKGEHYKAA